MTAMAADHRAARFAVYGRIARNEVADACAARYWQEDRCRAVAVPCGGQITGWFFDTPCRADVPAPDRPQGRALLAMLAGLHRRVSAVITADAYRVLPRRQAGAGIPGWHPAWHAPLLLADTGFTIRSPQDYDLMAGLLFGAGRPPGRGQAAPVQITRRAVAPCAEPPVKGRRAVRRRSSALPPDCLPGTGGTGRPQ